MWIGFYYQKKIEKSTIQRYGRVIVLYVYKPQGSIENNPNFLKKVLPPQRRIEEFSKKEEFHILSIWYYNSIHL